MSIVSQVYVLRKRLSEENLEKLLTILDDERKRRQLERDDEFVAKRPQGIRRD